MNVLPVITVYTAQDSPRLRFVLDWLLTEQLGLHYELTHDLVVAQKKENCIFYGPATGVINIHAGSLLWEKDIKPHTIQSGHWYHLYLLYYKEASENLVPFDLFAGIFYLLSRYEEYDVYTADRHGRYPAAASILSRDQVLERPVLDEWVSWFRELLVSKWLIEIPSKKFRFQPSYDIDIAWSYKNKGWGRWAGAATKELLQLDLKSLSFRYRVSRGMVQDPYDAFAVMQSLHQQYQLQPFYFILSALHATSFDKNIAPGHPEMRKLVQRLASEGRVGIHPSYYTHNNTHKFLQEKQILESTINQPITNSRQHYIRLFFPDTYRMLLSGGILADYSMGYATALGFRAGTSHSFYWYDLEKETTSSLRIHPFCFMDTTAHYDLKLSVDDAFKRLQSMQQRLEKCGGILHSIFHNFSLGTDPEWKGWKEAYLSFIAGIAAK